MTSPPSLSSRFPSFRGNAGFACHNLKLSCTAALQHRKPGDTTIVLVSNDFILKMGPTEVGNSKMNTKKGVLGRAYFRNRDCFQSFRTISDMSMTGSDRTWIHMHITVILRAGAGLKLSAAYHHVTSSRDCPKSTNSCFFSIKRQPACHKDHTTRSERLDSINAWRCTGKHHRTRIFTVLGMNPTRCALQKSYFRGESQMDRTRIPRKDVVSSEKLVPSRSPHL